MDFSLEFLNENKIALILISSESLYYTLLLLFAFRRKEEEKKIENPEFQQYFIYVKSL